MALSPAVTSFPLTALAVPMFLSPSIGAELVAWLPARWYFAGGLGIVGGADLLLALAARDLGAPWAFLGHRRCAIEQRVRLRSVHAQIAAAAVSAVPPDVLRRPPQSA